MENKFIFALGFFDGVHLGHQALLDVCRVMAGENHCLSGAVTFVDHPQSLVQGDAPALINTPADRRRLLAQFGMDRILELPFDEKMMTMPWQDFLAMLMVDYGAVGFVCGDDFRFGHRGQGNASLLQAYCQDRGLPWAIVPEQTLSGVRVSSTHVRKLLEQGDLTLANRFLGHAHVLTGEVISGRGIGRTLGIPTANLALPEGVICPRMGVYACRAWIQGQCYGAVTNVGNRPTVGGHHVTVEPWLLDFEGDLYGKTMTLEFWEFLRPERKFDSLDQLKAQIQSDAAQTKEILK